MRLQFSLWCIMLIPSSIVLSICADPHEKEMVYAFDTLFPTNLFTDILTYSMRVWATIYLLKKKETGMVHLEDYNQTVVKKLAHLSHSIDSLAQSPRIGYKKFEYLFTVLDKMADECEEETQVYLFKEIITPIIKKLSEIMDTRFYSVDAVHIRLNFISPVKNNYVQEPIEVKQFPDQSQQTRIPWYQFV